MNEVRESAAHKLKPSVSETTLSPSNPKPVAGSTHGSAYGKYILFGLRKSDSWVTGSKSIFELALSKPHSFFIIMTTRTITGRSTRNSRNARSVPGIAFGRTIPPRVSTPRRLPSVPLSESQFEELGSEHGDGNHGDEDAEQGGDFGDGNPDGPSNDPPDDNGPGDHHDDEDPYDDGNQPNLADAIAALARNVRSQRDSSQTKVREPNPFDGTDLSGDICQKT